MPAQGGDIAVFDQGQQQLLRGGQRRRCALRFSGVHINLHGLALHIGRAAQVVFWRTADKLPDCVWISGALWRLAKVEEARGVAAQHGLHGWRVDELEKGGLWATHIGLFLL